MALLSPPLDKRSEDIALLTNHLIKKYNHDNGANLTIGPDALKSLKNYPFPGNVRELENILERATALCENNHVTTDDLQLPDFQISNNETKADLILLTENIEKVQIKGALELNRWNQSATARSLGITLRQLRYKIEKLKLNKT